MKIGTFVGQKCVTLNDKEIIFFRDAISKAFHEYLETLGFGISILKSNTKYGAYYQIPFNASNKIVMRDSDGDCFIPKYVSILAGREMGYDEAKCGRFYEWKDGFKPILDISSYNITIDLIGDFRGYRRRNIERNVGITRTTYKYGTELIDVEPNEGFARIAKYLKGSHPTKVKF